MVSYCMKQPTHEIQDAYEAYRAACDAMDNAALESDLDSNAASEACREAIAANAAHGVALKAALEFNDAYTVAAELLALDAAYRAARVNRTVGTR